jgi:hypothetical protein
LLSSELLQSQSSQLKVAGNKLMEEVQALLSTPAHMALNRMELSVIQHVLQASMAMVQYAGNLAHQASLTLELIV